MQKYFRAIEILDAFSVLSILLFWLDALFIFFQKSKEAFFAYSWFLIWRHEKSPILEIGLRVVLATRHRHYGIENIALVKVVRLGLVRLGQV